MNSYEITLVISPDMAEFEAQKAEAKINSSITKKGGNIINNNFWGKHELAYPIKGHEFGYFATTVFSMPGAAISELTSEIRLTPEILRYLVISLEKENIKVDDLKKMDLLKEQPVLRPTQRITPAPVRPAPPIPQKDEATRMKELEEKLENILSDEKKET